MFSIKKKLDCDLRASLEAKSYKSYRVIVKCKTMQEIIESKIKSQRGVVIHSLPTIKCICADLSCHAIERIAEFPQVEYVCFDEHALLCGSSVLASNGTPLHHKYKYTGKGVCVGIIDTGTYPHPDLAHPVNKIKNFLDVVNNLKYPYDDNGHGTFMSGIICGNGHSSNGMYKGVAENCSLYSIKAFNRLGRGFVSDILYGMEVLLHESSNCNIRVINLPFELINANHMIVQLFHSYFYEASRRNIVVVVPSGHCGNKEGSLMGISTSRSCITVSGLDTTGEPKPYEFSSCGPCGKSDKPDFSAACVDICSLNTNPYFISERNGMKLYPMKLDKPYTCYTGTSIAASYISGLCAILFEYDPNLGCKDVMSILKASSHMLKVSRWQQGYGKIDMLNIFD